MKLRRTEMLVLAANGLFWLIFWVWLIQSIELLPKNAAELQDSVNYPVSKTLHLPYDSARSSTMWRLCSTVQLPAAATSRLLVPSFRYDETFLDGTLLVWRLVLTMLLSFAQWLLAARALEWLWDFLRGLSSTSLAATLLLVGFTGATATATTTASAVGVALRCTHTHNEVGESRNFYAPSCIYRAGLCGFTGKERDAETGLDYFLARYMSSAQGRFTSPDPVNLSIKHIENPQRWNMYVYVRNNPMVMIDPNGTDDFFVFRPLAATNGSQWNAAIAAAPKSGDKITIYNGAQATAGQFEKALQTPGAHVVFTGHSVEDSSGKAQGLMFANNEGVGVGTTAADGTVPGKPALSPGSPSAKTVAAFGCVTTDLQPQYSSTTFTGTSPTTDTVAQDAGALAYTSTLSRTGSMTQSRQAAGAAMSTATAGANRNPNKPMTYQPPKVCTTENGQTKCN